MPLTSSSDMIKQTDSCLRVRVSDDGATANCLATVCCFIASVLPEQSSRLGFRQVTRARIAGKDSINCHCLDDKSGRFCTQNLADGSQEPQYEAEWSRNRGTQQMGDSGVKSGVVTLPPERISDDQL
jgi:hypothetical protein